MTDYEQVKAQIDAFLVQDVSSDDDPDGSIRIDSFRFFMEQLQGIIEAANTEPPERVPFSSLARGDKFRFPDGTDVFWRVSPGGHGYAPVDNDGTNPDRLYFIGKRHLDTPVVRV